MTVKEFMERVNSQETGRVIAYIKDGLEDLNIKTETHINTTRIDINEDQRFYNIPEDMVRLLDIRVLNHNNSNDAYRTIPRLRNEPKVEDTDGI